MSPFSLSLFVRSDNYTHIFHPNLIKKVIIPSVPFELTPQLVFEVDSE